MHVADDQIIESIVHLLHYRKLMLQQYVEFIGILDRLGIWFELDYLFIVFFQPVNDIARERRQGLDLNQRDMEFVLLSVEWLDVDWFGDLDMFEYRFRFGGRFAVQLCDEQLS